MNKFTRLFVVVLTLALLVGAVVGITASANDGDVAYEEKDLILSYNVSYADYMHLYVAINNTIAVDATGIKATVEMNGETYEGIAIAADDADQTLYGDVTGHVLRTPGVAAKDMLDTIKITVYYTGTEGEGDAATTVNYIDSVEYSVAQYFFERLYKNGVIDATEGQDLARKNLYSAALSYGAAAQNLLTSDTELISNKIYVWGDFNLGLVDKDDYNLALGENLYKFTYYSLNGATGSDVASGTGYYGLDTSVKITSAGGDVYAGPDGSVTFDNLTPTTYAGTTTTIISGKADWSVEVDEQADLSVISTGDSNYIRSDKTSRDNSKASWLNMYAAAAAEGTTPDAYVFQARTRLNIKNTGDEFRFYVNGKAVSRHFLYNTSGQIEMTYDTQTDGLGVANNEWFTIRIVIKNYTDADTNNLIVYVYDEANSTFVEKASMVVAGYTDITKITHGRIHQGGKALSTMDVDYFYSSYLTNDALNSLGAGTIIKVTANRRPDYAPLDKGATLGAGVVTADNTTVENVCTSVNSDYSYAEVRTQDGETFLRAYKSNQNSNTVQTAVQFNKAGDEGSGNVVTFEAKMRVTAPEGQTMATGNTNGYQTRLWGSGDTKAINNAYLRESGGKIGIGTTISTVDVGEWFTFRITYTYNEADASATIKITLIDSDGAETPVDVTPSKVVTPDNIIGFRLTSGANARIVVDVKDASFSVGN